MSDGHCRRRRIESQRYMKHTKKIAENILGLKEEMLI
jgi:hypothetical protein